MVQAMDGHVRVDAHGVARVGGSRVRVEEVLEMWRAGEGSFARLREEFESLSPADLWAALAYAEDHPDEMDRRLAELREWEARLREEQRAHPGPARLLATRGR